MNETYQNLLSSVKPEVFKKHFFRSVCALENEFLECDKENYLAIFKTKKFRDCYTTNATDSFKINIDTKIPLVYQKLIFKTYHASLNYLIIQARFGLEPVVINDLDMLCRINDSLIEKS